MESYAGGELSTPKSGHGRPAPMSDPVAPTLDQLSQRRLFTGPDDLVFPGSS
jgi:hypothetical protein